MRQHPINTLKQGEHYTAKELDSFVSTTDVVLFSSNASQLFSEPEREYKVVHEVEGFFEHSSDDGEKYFRDKRAYVVEKV
ncbi:hypothetical protein JI666_03775 [Bacillus sp. NTK071]|uniref:hypothetical protein n=1 Tax=Bacillus sp. NTK071 TaxID=2802175 RepID=UPI001A8DDC71|nr:hypothetical protein [Bacillus sp. NTK071]MBN8207864.1 hypothetical protein [Bacillus sp. NTK071]